MIYVFKRKGFLVPLVFIFSALFLAILKDESSFYKGGDTFLSDIFFVVFCILLPLGLKLNKGIEQGKAHHTFYWLRIEYWAGISLLLGIFFRV